MNLRRWFRKELPTITYRERKPNILDPNLYGAGNEIQHEDVHEVIPRELNEHNVTAYKRSSMIRPTR